MRIDAIVAGLVLAAGPISMAAAQSPSGPDTFAIHIDLDQLQTTEGSDAFDARLERNAHAYCQSSAPTANSSSIATCEGRVISAVETAVIDAASDEGTPIVWRAGYPD
ncbi:MAG: UrcA family protein [Pseudomonadota bacterium]